MDLDVNSTLQKAWTERVRSKWAAHRAAASVSGSDGGAWLDGDAADAFACDASLTPVVLGEVNPAVLDDLVRLCVELAGYGHGPAPSTPESPDTPETPGSAESSQADRIPRPGPVPPTAQGRDALEQKIIGRAVALVSGPSGLASFLRRQQLGARLAGPSLPLDVGVSRDIPTAIRRAVIERDQHCRFPSGCDQPALGCEVHHITHQANGGATSTDGCALFCWFHHHIVIHQWGWTVILNSDGTTTAYSPGKTKVFHSHGPPPRPSG